MVSGRRKPEALAVPDRFRGDRLGVIDVQGQSQNTLGREAVEELEAIVTAVEEGARDKRLRGVMFMSGKEKSFIAGADIREFDNLKTEAGGCRRRSCGDRRFSTASSSCPFRRWQRSTAFAWAAAWSLRWPAIIASPTARTARGLACPR